MSAIAVDRWSRLADRHDAVRAFIQAIRSRVDSHQEEIARLQVAMSVDVADARAAVVAVDDGLAYATYPSRELARVGGRMEMRGLDTRMRRPQFDDHVKRIGELQAEVRRLRGEINVQSERNAPIAHLVNEGRRLLEARRIRLPPR
jgi:hypothetical protein